MLSRLRLFFREVVWTFSFSFFFKGKIQIKLLPSSVAKVWITSWCNLVFTIVIWWVIDLYFPLVFSSIHASRSHLRSSFSSNMIYLSSAANSTWSCLLIMAKDHRIHLVLNNRLKSDLSQISFSGSKFYLILKKVLGQR